MSTLSKVILTFIVLAVAFGFGRWSAPEKVKIQEKTVYVEKKSSQSETDRDKHRKTVTVVVTHPDGTTTSTTTTEEDTKTDRRTAETDDKSGSSELSKEITRGSLTTVSALAGTNITSPLGVDFGLAVSRPVLGPITIGIFGFKSGLAGASLGLSF